MNNYDLKNEVQKRYKQGDIITLNTWNNEGKLKGKTKVTIIKFYQSYVLVEVNGFKECYKYWDILQMTKGPEKSEPIQSRGSYNHKFA